MTDKSVSGEDDVRIHWQITVAATFAVFVAGARSEPAAQGADRLAPLVQIGVKNGQTPIELMGNITQGAEKSP